jgi:hypothetical protein
MKSKSVKKKAKMVVEEFLEDGGFFEDDEFVLGRVGEC